MSYLKTEFYEKPHNADSPTEAQSIEDASAAFRKTFDLPQESLVTSAWWKFLHFDSCCDVILCQALPRRGAWLQGDCQLAITTFASLPPSATFKLVRVILVEVENATFLLVLIPH